MKFLVLIGVLALVSGNTFADNHEKPNKPKHDKEHQHAKDAADHEHDDEHHKDHDHKKHHPDHVEAAPAAAPVKKK